MKPGLLLVVIYLYMFCPSTVCLVSTFLSWPGGIYPGRRKEGPLEAGPACQVESGAESLMLLLVVFVHIRILRQLHHGFFFLINIPGRDQLIRVLCVRKSPEPSRSELPSLVSVFSVFVFNISQVLGVQRELERSARF